MCSIRTPSRIDRAFSFPSFIYTRVQLESVFSHKSCYERTGSKPKYKCAPDRYRRLISTSDLAVNLLLNGLYANGTDQEHMYKRNQEMQRLFVEGIPKTEIGRQHLLLACSRLANAQSTQCMER